MLWREAKIYFIRKDASFQMVVVCYFWSLLFLVFLIILNHLRYSVVSDLSQGIGFHLMISKFLPNVGA